MHDQQGHLLFDENQRILNYLKNSRLFESFPKELLEKLIPISHFAQYTVGEKILEEGKENKKIYFLIHGKVAIYVAGQFISELKRVGDIFGEMSIIGGKPTIADVVAEEETEVFYISSDQVGSYADLNPKELQNFLYRLFAKILSEKLSLTSFKARQYEKTNQALEEVKERLEEDITERQEIEKQLQMAREMAEQANIAKTQFLANMSHEIRTPLNAILGLTQILLVQGKKGYDPEILQSHLTSIKKSGEHLGDLLNNILDLSKIEAGKVNLLEESFSIQEFIEDLHDLYLFQAEQKNIHFDHFLSPSLPSYLHSDRGKMVQILTNLIGNALKFTPENKKIELRAIQEKENVILFQVKDEGIGIPPDKIQKIFHDFEQGDAQITRKFGGTGLGLAITKKLVNLLNGVIEVESKLGKGTTFSVYLPLDKGKSPRQDFQEEVESLHFSKESIILVVEDNLMNQVMIEAAFEELGLSIHLANCGELGIQKAIELKPHFILMDLHMPGMSGIEATKKIHALPELQKIPIVAFSADAFYEKKEEAYSAGACGYLTKPINLDELVFFLKQYLPTE